MVFPWFSHGEITILAMLATLSGDHVHRAWLDLLERPGGHDMFERRPGSTRAVFFWADPQGFQGDMMGI